MYNVIEHYKGSEYNKQFLSVCLKMWAQSILIKNSI